MIKLFDCYVRVISGQETTMKRTGTRLEYTGTKNKNTSNLLRLLVFISVGGEGRIPEALYPICQE
jgi:hypothetical protein